MEPVEAGRSEGTAASARTPDVPQALDVLAQLVAAHHRPAVLDDGWQTALGYAPANRAGGAVEQPRDAPHREQRRHGHDRSHVEVGHSIPSVANSRSDSRGVRA